MPHLYRPPSPPDSDDSGPAIEMDSTQVILDLPPPAELPPGYSAHLAEDELRLISTVHLDQNHPAASFFSQMTSNALSPLQANSGLPGGSGSGPTEQSTGSKKLKLTLTTGAERTNISGSGPMFIRMNRGGKIEGRLELGKVDHVTGLDVAVSCFFPLGWGDAKEPDFGICQHELLRSWAVYPDRHFASGPSADFHLAC